MKPPVLPRGPLLVDLAGPVLTAEERERLLHPAVGGVILFARNCLDAAQVRDLCADLHALRQPPLLIAIDQEGGRVQRLTAGVTRFPPQASLGRLWDQAGMPPAVAMARDWGRLLGTELRGLGIDLDFTPCVDLDWGVSAVIGDRALHRDPQVVATLAEALWQGLATTGLRGVAKHFPGHGAVAADSHLALPVDRRPWTELAAADLYPFAALIAAGIPGIMPAHCLYPEVDDQPAGFSRRWLRDILRRQMGFAGAIISDDLSMGGAHGQGDVPARAAAALAAGCDLLLICNDPAAADQAMAALAPRSWADRAQRLAGLAGADPGAGLAAEEAAALARRIAGLHAFPS